MAGPFVFIGTHSFKEGKLEDFKRDSRALAQLVKRRSPASYLLPSLQRG
jgi:hypothetical protein